MKKEIQIQTDTWTKIFACYLSTLTCSYLGQQHTSAIKSMLGTGPTKVIITTKRGYSVCHYEKQDFEQFGNELAERALQNPQQIGRWCIEVKQRTDVLRALMQEQKKSILRPESHKVFTTLLEGYVPVYVAVKQVANFLPKSIAQKYLPLLDASRLYTETLYTEVEQFMIDVAQRIGKKYDLPEELVRCCTKEEFEQHLQDETLPERGVLEERHKNCVIVCENGICKFVTGPQAMMIETRLTGNLNTQAIKGMCAYPGKVRGKVKIIFDPNSAKDFQMGDILVTGMTRPEYIHLMEKASAIITDAGGLLCHAAIVAREMKKPCIIGTEKATKVLKDRDLVEMDAEAGTIRKV